MWRTIIGFNSGWQKFDKSHLYPAHHHLWWADMGATMARLLAVILLAATATASSFVVTDSRGIAIYHPAEGQTNLYPPGHAWDAILKTVDADGA